MWQELLNLHFQIVVSVPVCIAASLALKIKPHRNTVGRRIIPPSFMRSDDFGDVASVAPERFTVCNPESELHSAANYTPELLRPAPIGMLHEHFDCFARKCLFAARNHAFLLRILDHPSQLRRMNFSAMNSLCSLRAKNGRAEGGSVGSRIYSLLVKSEG